jgi:hypothetical protein
MQMCASQMGETNMKRVRNTFGHPDRVYLSVLLTEHVGICQLALSSLSVVCPVSISSALSDHRQVGGNLLGTNKSHHHLVV